MSLLCVDESKSKCQKQREEEIRKFGYASDFVPVQCTTDGYYKKYQSNLGGSYCVDKHTGKIIPGSTVEAGKGFAQCDGKSSFDIELTDVTRFSLS